MTIEPECEVDECPEPEVPGIWCPECGNLVRLQDAAMEGLQAEVVRLRNVIREVFCLELSHGKPGTEDADLDILGASLVPWSKECRLTVIEVLRKAEPEPVQGE